MSEQVKNINSQTPATKNQISNKKPGILKNSNVLQGYFCNSMNGATIKPIAYKKIMPGEVISQYSIEVMLRMLTPKTPAYQKLNATFEAYFVPDKRVWENADKFYAQKGGASEQKIEESPNLGGKLLPHIIINTNDGNAVQKPLTDTTLWRDSYISSYIPRYQTGIDANGEAGTIDTFILRMPKVEALRLRGFKAIYNDFLRNKQYDEELQEYKTDTVSEEEWQSYLPFNGTNNNNTPKTILRKKRDNSYYTDYRTELLGQEINAPTDFDNNPISATEFLKMTAELRSQAENADLNDYDLYVKLYGTKPLTEGKVVLLGRTTRGINYQAVTQSAYNVNQNIQEQFQQLGEQGAYSFSHFNLNLVGMKQFNEPGYLHIICTISADNVFSCAFDRLDLNTRWDELYRPDLIGIKNDVIKRIEKSATNIRNENELEEIDGFKRKFSEYFKLPNVISGDYTSINWVETTKPTMNYENTEEEVRTVNIKDTFTFFETSDELGSLAEPEVIDRTFKKNIWQDYTDLQINKNQAIRNEIINIVDTSNEQINHTRLLGQNQFDVIGVATCISDMPIDESIKDNFTRFGEM